MESNSLLPLRSNGKTNCHPKQSIIFSHPKGSIVLHVIPREAKRRGISTINWTDPSLRPFVQDDRNRFAVTSREALFFSHPEGSEATRDLNKQRAAKANRTKHSFHSFIHNDNIIVRFMLLFFVIMKINFNFE